MQSLDPDHFFQTSDSIAKRTRREAKAKNTHGRPITFTSKPLALVADVTKRQYVYVALSAGEARRVDLGTRSISPPYRQPSSTASRTGAATPLTSLAFLPSNGDAPAVLFAGSWSGHIYAFAANSRALLFTLGSGHTDFVKAVTLFLGSISSPATEPSSHSTRPILASAGADARIVIWDASPPNSPNQTRKPLATLAGHGRSVLAVVADPVPPSASEVYLWSGSSDAEVRRWRVRLRASSADGSIVAANAGPVPFATPLRPAHTSITALTFAPVGEADLWIASADGSARCLSRPEPAPEAATAGGAATAGETASTAGDARSQAIEAALAWQPDTELHHGATNPVRCLALSPDGTSLVTGCGDEDIWLWDVASAELRGKFEGHADEVTAVLVLPGEKGLAGTSPTGEKWEWTVVSASLDGTLRIWEMVDLTTALDEEGEEVGQEKEEKAEEAAEKVEVKNAEEAKGKGDEVRLTEEEEAELAALMEDDS